MSRRALNTFHSSNANAASAGQTRRGRKRSSAKAVRTRSGAPARAAFADDRSEEHTSELQSHLNLVCRLLLEKKNKLPDLMLIKVVADFQILQLQSTLR